MITKPRFESSELLTLRYLSPRISLSEKEKQYYLNLEKGYEGERLFDQNMVPRLADWLFVNDLRLEHHHSYFQIDSIGITQETLYLLDIKNFDGDFIVEKDVWKSLTGTELKNPLHQLARCETLFKKFVQAKGMHFSIKSFLIFINPHFTLYQSPLNPSIIFPTQIERFITTLQSEKTNLSNKHRNVSDLLISSHQEKYPYSSSPHYNYNEIAKGIVCSSCNSLITTVSDWERLGKLVCSKCFFNEDQEKAILQCVKEIQVLFPDRKISTVEIFNWCGGLISKKKIQRVLTQNYQRQGQGKFSYYVERN